MIFLLKYWHIMGLGVLAVLLGVTSLRLNHAKHDLTEARAALINPTTHKTWQSEAIRDAGALAVCNTARLAQNAAVAASAAETARKLAAATKGLSDARAVAESYRRSVPAVRAYVPKGSDACARSADVDRMILGDLK